MTVLLENHRTFDSVAELNEAIRLHLREHRYELNKTAVAVLETLSRYAVKYTGAAWLKTNTLADLIGKSVPTVRRAIALLERLGIVERVVYIRPKRGGNGGNIIRVLPAEPPNDRPEMIARDDVTKPSVSKDEAINSKKESISFKSSKSSLLHNTYQQPAAALATFYGRFKSFVTSTIGQDQSLVSRLYGIYRAHTTILTKYNAYNTTDVEHAGYEALRVTLMATKTRKIKNLPGFYNGVLDRFLDRLANDESQRVLAEL